MFTYETTIDLKRPQRDIYWDTIANVGDKKAHSFVIYLVKDKTPVDISTGYTVQLLATRHDGNTRYLDGEVVENAAVAELDYTCYEVPGELRCTMEISKDGDVISAARIFLLIGEKYGEGVVDPSHTIPSVAELLAEIETVRTATKETKEAANAANSAASSANTAANTANSAAQTANTATENANTAAKAANDAASAANTAAASVEEQKNAASEAAARANAAATISA